MVGIVDYGVGNLFSLRSSLLAIGQDVFVTGDGKKLGKADQIILPGVGAFEDAAAKLRSTGLDEVLCRLAEKGKPLMGICLGMQLLFEKSYEYGVHKGLGLIEGCVVPIADFVPSGFKIPQIGWNSLSFSKPSPIFKNAKEGDFVYFVHSYQAFECEKYVTATTDYGAPITAAVQKGNVFGCQFHPEKSGTVGLGILSAFAELKEGLC